MINSLDSWLDAAAVSLAHQEAKLSLFHERGIYSEYWVQNELSALLPWGQPGIYIVDCGPALALPASVSKYPDFSLRFGTSNGSPLYFIELKDLLTNAARNVGKLREETSVMAKMSRASTISRWRKHTGKAKRYSALMLDALESAPLAFCGLVVGAGHDVPESLPGFQSSLRNITSDWVMGFYELMDPEISIMNVDAEAAEPAEIETDQEESDATDLSLARCLDAAHECENNRVQIAPELPISTVSEARLLIMKIEAVLKDYNASAESPILHAKPWVWTPKSRGKAITQAGREYCVEIRFSCEKSPVR